MPFMFKDISVLVLKVEASQGDHDGRMNTVASSALATYRLLSTLTCVFNLVQTMNMVYLAACIKPRAITLYI